MKCCGEFKYSPNGGGANHIHNRTVTYLVADWLAIKTEYITSDVGTKALAEKHGVSYNTLAHRSASEKWVAEREEYRRKVAEKMQIESAKKISDTESEIAAIKSRMRLMWWQRQEWALSNLLSEEKEGSRNSADARRELQNFADLIATEPKEAGNIEQETDPLSKAFLELEGDNASVLP